MKKIALAILLFTACAHTALAQQVKKRSYKEELLSLYAATQKHFYDSASGLYNEHYTGHKDVRKHTYLWPVCGLMQAYNEMDATLPQGNYLGSILPVINAYYNPAPPAPGYDSYVVKDGGGARFYDDNQWIGIAAMDAYSRTANKTYLQIGETVYRFMMTAFDTVTGGGLYWEEKNYKSKNTCSNAPGVVIALQLYKATKQQKYLDTALLLFNWTNKTLRSPQGLYYDNINLQTRHVDERLYAYNAGCMLQSNIYLYEITKDKKYLAAAKAIADSSVRYFFREGKFKDNYWFSVVLLRAYVHLVKYDKDKKYIQAFKACLDRALDENKNDNGLMGKDKRGDLLAQAGMMEILARYVWLEKNVF